MSGQTHLAFARLAIAACVVSIGVASAAYAEPISIADVKHDGQVDFEKEVLPILRKNCLACHNASDAEGDLVLETPETIKTGGFEGEAVMPGKGAESLLILLASHQKESFMPPPDNKVGAKNLTPDELGLIKLWIDQGAKGEVSGLIAPISWQPLPVGLNPIYAAAISADGQTAVAARANQIFVYDIPSKRLLSRLTDPALLEQGLYSKAGVAHIDVVQSIAIHPSGDLLASGGYRTVKLWQRQRDVRVNEFGGFADAKAVAVSSNGELYAIAQQNGEIQLIEAASGKSVGKLSGHAAAATSVAFNADSSQLLSGSQDKTVRIWNVAERKQLAEVATPAEVNAVAWIDEAKHVVSGGADNVIRTWANPLLAEAKPAEEASEEGNAEEEAPQPVKELQGHSQPVVSLVSVPGTPTQIISASTDGTVRQWDALGGNQIRSMTHGGPVVSVAVRADNKRIVSVSSNNTAKLWNAENGQQIAELRGSPAAKLAAEAADREVALAKKRVENHKKDLEEAEKRKKSEEENQTKAAETLKTTEEEFKKKEEAAKEPVAKKEEADTELEAAQAEFAKAEEAKGKAEEALKKAEEALAKAQEEAGKATEEADNKAKEEAVKKADEARKQLAEAKQAADKEFTDKQNAVKQAENKVKQADGPASKATEERNAAERAFQAAQRSVERAAVSVKKANDAVPVAQQALKAREDAAAEAEKAKEEAQKAISESEMPLLAAAFSPDGATFATSGDDKVIRLWDSETGTAVDQIKGHEAAVSQLAFNPAGELLSIAANNTAVIWNVDSDWKLVRTIGGIDSDVFADRVTALAFSYDGTLLASGGGEPSRGGELKIWKVEDGSLVRDIAEAHSDTVFDVEFSRDGEFLASSGADRFLKVFKVSDGSFVRSFEGHTHHVMGVSWRADSRVIASSGADKVVKVWNVLTGDQDRTITGYNKEVTSIRFVGMSDDILTGSGDRSVTTKRTSNGGNIRGFGGSTDFIYTVDVSDDGKTIIAGGEASVLRVWDENGQSLATFEPPVDPEQTASTEGGE